MSKEILVYQMPKAYTFYYKMALNYLKHQKQGDIYHLLQKKNEIYVGQ